MALVHNDQVKEIAGVLMVQPWPPFILGDRLIDREVHLPSHRSDAVLDLASGVTEGGKDLVFRIVNEDVAIGEVENSWSAVIACSIPASLRQLPADLKGDQSLSGSGRHRQEDPTLP